jgi:formate hydrogenlyase subunit 6/NADH:ubiquinone oxidoreductase subunit I
MEIVQVSKQQFAGLVDSLIAKQASRVIGPVPKSGRYSFEVLTAASELALDYDQTSLSPRKFLMPSRDTLLTYATRDAASYKPVSDAGPAVIIGVHPGDLTAIALYDKVYSQDQTDTQYCDRRAQVTLVGLYPTKPYQYRFTSSMIREKDPYLAADLMMTDMGDGTYAVEIVTDKGKALLSGSGAATADAATVKKMAGRKNAAKDGVALPVKREELAKKLAGQEKHETFKTRGDKCFSCGSCVLVCPTCVCFDVRDKVDLTLKNGIRYRTWDGCTIENFATCAGGHNFRKTAADRVRHRLFRKTVYLQEKYGITGCVGCGRCTAACTADIASIADMVGDIVGKGK